MSAAAATGPVTLNVDSEADTGQPGEFITVSIEGTVVGTINGNGSDCTLSTDSFSVPSAVINAATADGSVEITFTPSFGFGVLNQVGNCGSLNDLSSSTITGVFGVVGSLDGVSQTAAPGPGGDAQTDLVAARAAMITANTLDTTRRIGRLENGTGLLSGTLAFAGLPLAADLPVDVQVTQNGANFATGFDIGNAIGWVEGSYTSFDDQLTDDGSFAILHAGVDFLVNSDLMIGVSAQFDRFDQTATSGEALDSSGWMLGPVATARLAENLFIDGRLAYGRADNDLLQGGSTDNFGSTRALAELALVGQTTLGAFDVFPEAELLYFREETEAYTSATLGAVDASEVAIAQARLGGQLEHPIGTDYVGYARFDSVFTDIREGTISDGSFAREIEGWSGEFGLGLRFANANGVTMHTSITRGGLFTDAESTTASFELHIPLN